MSSLLFPFCTPYEVGLTNIGKVFAKLSQQNPSIWQDWMTDFNWNEPCEKLSLFRYAPNDSYRGSLTPRWPVEELIHHGSLDFIKTFLSSQCNPSVRLENSSFKDKDSWGYTEEKHLWILSAIRRGDLNVFDHVLEKIPVNEETAWTLFNWGRGQTSRSENPICILASRNEISGETALKMVKKIEKKWTENFVFGPKHSTTKNNIKELYIGLLYNACFYGNVGLVDVILDMKSAPPLHYKNWKDILASGQIQWAKNNYVNLQEKYSWIIAEDEKRPWQEVLDHLADQYAEAKEGLSRGFSFELDWFTKQENQLKNWSQEFASMAKSQSLWGVDKNYSSGIAQAVIRLKDTAKTYEIFDALKLPVTSIELEWSLNNNELFLLNDRLKNFGMSPDFKKSFSKIFVNWAQERRLYDKFKENHKPIKNLIKTFSSLKGLNLNAVQKNITEYMSKDQAAFWEKIFLSAFTPETPQISKVPRL